MKSRSFSLLINEFVIEYIPESTDFCVNSIRMVHRKDNLLGSTFTETLFEFTIVGYRSVCASLLCHAISFIDLSSAPPETEDLSSVFPGTHLGEPALNFTPEEEEPYSLIEEYEEYEEEASDIYEEDCNRPQLTITLPELEVNTYRMMMAPLSDVTSGLEEEHERARIQENTEKERAKMLEDEASRIKKIVQEEKDTQMLERERIHKQTKDREVMLMLEFEKEKSQREADFQREQMQREFEAERERNQQQLIIAKEQVQHDIQLMKARGEEEHKRMLIHNELELDVARQQMERESQQMLSTRQIEQERALHKGLREREQMKQELAREKLQHELEIRQMEAQTRKAQIESEMKVAEMREELEQNETTQTEVTVEFPNRVKISVRGRMAEGIASQFSRYHTSSATAPSEDVD